MADSKHKRALELLGFKPITGAPFGGSAAPPIVPYFTASQIMTYAKDETGRTWMVAGTVDLSSLGFQNNSEDVRIILEAMGDLPKPH